MYQSALDLNGCCPLSRGHVSSSCRAASSGFARSSLAGAIPALCDDAAGAPRGPGGGSPGHRARVAANASSAAAPGLRRASPPLRQQTPCPPLAQLSVQMSFSLWEGEFTFAEEPCYPGGVWQRKGASVLRRGAQIPTLDVWDTKPSGCIRHRAPSRSPGAAVVPFLWGPRKQASSGEVLAGPCRGSARRSPRYGEASPPRAMACGGPELRLPTGRAPSPNHRPPALSAYRGHRPRLRTQT